MDGSVACFKSSQDETEVPRREISQAWIFTQKSFKSFCEWMKYWKGWLFNQVLLIWQEQCCTVKLWRCVCLQDFEDQKREKSACQIKLVIQWFAVQVTFPCLEKSKMNNPDNTSWGRCYFSRVFPKTSLYINPAACDYCQCFTHLGSILCVLF